MVDIFFTFILRADGIFQVSFDYGLSELHAYISEQISRPYHFRSRLTQVYN